MQILGVTVAGPVVLIFVFRCCGADDPILGGGARSSMR